MLNKSKLYSACTKSQVLDKKTSFSKPAPQGRRLAKSENQEFTVVNEEFSDKHNAENGVFLPTLYRTCPGFTVIELVIVMIISAIVIGIMYLYFMQFQGYIQQVTNDSDEFMQLGFFNQVLSSDMKKGDEIYYKGNVLTIATGKQEIEYRFKQNRVIRTFSDVREEFPIITTLPVVETMDDYNDLVQTIEFDIPGVKGFVQRYFYYKKYNALVLFKNYNLTK